MIDKESDESWKEYQESKEYLKKESKCVNCDCPSDSMCGCACHSINSHSQIQPNRSDVRATGDDKLTSLKSNSSDSPVPFISRKDMYSDYRKKFYALGNQIGYLNKETFRIFMNDLFVEKSVYEREVEEWKHIFDKQLETELKQKNEIIKQFNIQNIYNVLEMQKSFDARIQKLKDEISNEIHPMMHKKHQRIMKIIDSVMKG